MLNSFILFCVFYCMSPVCFLFVCYVCLFVFLFVEREYTFLLFSAPVFMLFCLWFFFFYIPMFCFVLFCFVLIFVYVMGNIIVRKAHAMHFVSLIIPLNHVKPEQDLKQKNFWGQNTRILDYVFPLGYSLRGFVRRGMLRVIF